MTVSFNLKMIRMPNFITYEVPAGQRQDGFNPNSNTIPVEMLDENAANKYAEEMKEAFINHWKTKKTNP